MAAQQHTRSATHATGEEILPNASAVAAHMLSQPRKSLVRAASAAVLAGFGVSEASPPGMERHPSSPDSERRLSSSYPSHPSSPQKGSMKSPATAEHGGVRSVPSSPALKSQGSRRALKVRSAISSSAASSPRVQPPGFSPDGNPPPSPLTDLSLDRQKSSSLSATSQPKYAAGGAAASSPKPRASLPKSMPGWPEDAPQLESQVAGGATPLLPPPAYSSPPLPEDGLAPLPPPMEATSEAREKRTSTNLRRKPLADQKAREEEREKIESQRQEEEAKLKEDLEKERARLKEQMAQLSDEQSQERERSLAEEREKHMQQLEQLKSEAQQLEEENRKRIEADKEAALSQAQETRKKFEEERQKLQQAMQKTKEDAEKRRQEMLEKIREEAEELERSRVKAEEQRTLAQQAEQQRIENEMRERERAALEAAQRREAEKQRLQEAKAKAKAARQERKNADAERKAALVAKRAKRENDARTSAKNIPRVVNSELSNKEFSALEERLEKESNQNQFAYEEIESSLKEQLEDTLEHIDESVEQRIQTRRMKLKVNCQRIQANCQEKLLNFEGYIQELNVAKLVLDNERIFANEAQNLALNEQSEKIEEDLHEAEKNRRMLESNADFAVDKENKQVKRWEKRLQKKAQRRRQKTTRDLEQQMETNTERHEEMKKGFEKARKRDGDSYALDNTRVEWGLWHEEITEQCDEFQERSVDRSKAKRSQRKQELSEMKELIVDYKERAERCARERITQENKYHEKVDQLAEEHEKRVLQKNEEEEAKRREEELRQEEEEQRLKEEESDDAKLAGLEKRKRKTRVNIIKLSSKLEILRLEEDEESAAAIGRVQEEILADKQKMSEINNEINMINARLAAENKIEKPAVVAAPPPPGAGIVGAAGPPPPPPPMLLALLTSPTLPRPSSAGSGGSGTSTPTRSSTPVPGGGGGFLDALRKGVKLRKTRRVEKKPREDESLTGVALALKMALDKRRGDLSLRQNDMDLSGVGAKNADSDSDSDWSE